MDQTKHILEGSISVKAAILGGNRSVYELIVDHKKKDKDTSFIKHQAAARNIPVTLTNRETIDALCEGSTHGGIAAWVGERQYQPLEQLIESKTPFLVLLEGIEDPYNFAYALRSLCASGCNGIIVGERNWTTAASTIAKASAGASEYIPIHVSKDVAHTIQQLKEQKIKLLCCMREDAVAYYEQDLTQGICIAIGGELRGLSKSVLELSDQNIYIPYGSTFRNALTASSATAVVAFETARQRAVKP